MNVQESIGDLSGERIFYVEQERTSALSF